ncbi:hypothetical protein DXA36_31705 [Eisenbergiella sp. OF01-20]|nr:hypothetical protein DXA36_31705 [Eisenbergiella sp. OF01-20]
MSKQRMARSASHPLFQRKQTESTACFNRSGYCMNRFILVLSYHWHVYLSIFFLLLFDQMIKFFKNVKTFSGVMTIYICKGKSLQVDLKEEGGGRL